MPDDVGGIVYVLTNSAMPGLTKIGKTTQEDIQSRMSQLYTTGVPVQFDCAFACQVKDCAAVESALHQAFGGARVNPKREFFRIEPERVVAILKLLAVQDVTPQVEHELNEALDVTDKAAREELKRSRRPPINFETMGIPVGATLTSKDDAQVQLKVVDARHVEYDGAACALTKAHKEIFKLDYSVQPSPYWTYNGRTLKEIYDETYPLDDEE
jgi:hypothetical protein